MDATRHARAMAEAMRRLLVALLLFILVAPAAAQDDPLACLPERADGAVTWTLNESGRWTYRGTSSVPVLEGIHGQWYGYENGDGWQGAFGWPNDMYAYRKTALYRYDTEVAQLWFYKSFEDSDLVVLFVYESMVKWSDSSGDHYGEHDFCWWGEVTNEYE